MRTGEFRHSGASLRMQEVKGRIRERGREGVERERERDSVQCPSACMCACVCTVFVCVRARASECARSACVRVVTGRGQQAAAASTRRGRRQFFPP
eukprot:8480421-Pyramimonas_sp.AAC.1